MKVSSTLETFQGNPLDESGSIYVGWSESTIHESNVTIHLKSLFIKAQLNVQKSSTNIQDKNKSDDQIHLEYCRLYLANIVMSKKA